MSRLLWLLAWIGVAIWSLFAWASYGIVDFFGRLAVRHSDAVSSHPETVEWLSWMLGALKGLGLTAIVLVWAAVSLLMLAVPWLVDRVARREPARDPGLIDLGRDQYVVEQPGAAPPRPTGQAPHLERR